MPGLKQRIEKLPTLNHGVYELSVEKILIELDKTIAEMPKPCSEPECHSEVCAERRRNLKALDSNDKKEPSDKELNGWIKDSEEKKTIKEESP